MATRSEALAREFETKVEAMVALVAGLSDADWKRVTDAEKWTVGVTAHHLAGAFEPVAGMSMALAAGRPPGGFSRADLDQMNAQHARDHAGCTKAETLGLLENGAASAAAVVRSLRDDDLAKSGTVFTDAPPMTVEQLVTGGLLHHIDEHAGSIRRTIGAPQEILLTRVLDAPRSRVFEAWTEPERMKQWFGPTGFTTPVCTIDLRPGGRVHTCMRTPDGKDYWSIGVYREIVVPERIVCTDSFADAEGNVVEPTHYGMSETWPREALLTVTFAEQGGTTIMTLRHSVGAAAAAERDMCRQGWSETLERLAQTLAKD